MSYCIRPGKGDSSMNGLACDLVNFLLQWIEDAEAGLLGVD